MLATEKRNRARNGDTAPGDQREPLLFVDVNLGENQKTRIAMFNDSVPKMVAQQFVKEHKLGNHILDNLTNLLEQ